VQTCATSNSDLMPANESTTLSTANDSSNLESSGIGNQDQSDVSGCDEQALQKFVCQVKENITMCAINKWNRFDKWKRNLQLDSDAFSGFAEEDLTDLEDPYRWMELLLSEQGSDPPIKLPERKRPLFLFEIENTDGPVVKKKKQDAGNDNAVPIMEDLSISEVSCSDLHIITFWANNMRTILSIASVVNVVYRYLYYF
jgi:hypothetical protein